MRDVVQACAGLLLAASLAIPRTVVAEQRCTPDVTTDATGRVLDGEGELRSKTAGAVACAWEREPRDDEFIVAVTDFYKQHSRSPSCELLVINAQANIRLARAFEGREALPVATRRDVYERWRLAWEVLSGLSLAWDRAKASTVPDSARILERCIKPARDELSKYPSVTVSINSSDLSGYALRWDGVTRAHNLPRILPGGHRLEIEPPPGKNTTLTIDGAVVLDHYRGPVLRDLELRWAQRVWIDIEFHEVVPHDSESPSLPADAPGAGAAPLKPDAASRLLLWGGAASLVLGVAGMTLSIARAETLEHDSKAIDRRCGRACSARELQESDAAWQAQTEWRRWGYSISGALCAAGLTGIVYAILKDSPDSPQLGMSSPLWVMPAPGVFGLGMTLGF